MYSWLIKTKAALTLLAGNFALKLLTENEESFLALVTKKMWLTTDLQQRNTIKSFQKFKDIDFRSDTF